MYQSVAIVVESYRLIESFNHMTITHRVTLHRSTAYPVADLTPLFVHLDGSSEQLGGRVANCGELGKGARSTRAFLAHHTGKGCTCNF